MNAWIALDDMPLSMGGGFALSTGSHVAPWRHEAYGENELCVWFFFSFDDLGPCECVSFLTLYVSLIRFSIGCHG